MSEITLYRPIVADPPCEMCGGTGEGNAPFAGYDKGVCPRCAGPTEERLQAALLNHVELAGG